MARLCTSLCRCRWACCLAALLLGALTTLTFAPFGLWWLAPLLCAPLFGLLRGTTVKRGMLLGYCYGLGLFTSGASWVYVSIHDIGGSPMPLALVMTALFVAGLALFYLIVGAFYRLLSPRASMLEPLTFAAAWTLGEVFRGWFLTGFPWLLLGTSQVEGPLAGYAPIGGVFLISFVIALSGALLWQLFTRRHYWLAAPLIALWGIGLILPTRWLDAAPRSLSVALVQGDLPQTMKWSVGGVQNAVNRYLDLTREHASDAELVVWPEVALPLTEGEARPIFATAQSTMRPHSTLISGILTRQSTGTFNSAVAYDQSAPQGQLRTAYAKHRLVPFGEYVPLPGLLQPIIQLLGLPAPYVIQGPADQPPLHADVLRIGMAICYEIAYPDLVRDQARHANVLMTISNDSWFGHSIGPLQHMQMAQMRALENNRYLLRDTSNGWTGVIGPDGKLLSDIPRFEPGVLNAQVHPMLGETLFTRTGSLPIILISVVLAAAGALASRYRRARDQRAQHDEASP
ncbi:Apolipoprotein N-acyltransferase GT2 [Carnimonas sp. R-84981]|uniref:apolipoprotein N-acyltransferase n=1 Tax=Carnimonas bestiolae TaxID=3402172 RepID=UPI003EDC7602